MNYELIARLQEIDYSMHIRDIASGSLEPYIISGLLAALFCLTGTGRSQAGSEYLNHNGIPSICVEGGLRYLREEMDRYSQMQAISTLNRLPFLIAHIDKQEKKDYLTLLSLMRVEYHQWPQ